MKEINILNGNTLYYPVVEEGVTWNTERKSSPGTLKFTVRYEDALKIEEGNVVTLKDGDIGIFFGYIFSKEISDVNRIAITAYDQLRYFKNKDNYVYSNKSTSDLVKMIANDYQLTIGRIEDTKYKISRCESESSLFDIINNSNDETLKVNKEIYVLYDDFGELCLKNILNLKLNLLLDHDTVGGYKVSSSIDENTYNQIKLIYDDKKTSNKIPYMIKDDNNIAKWGILQYVESIDDISSVDEKRKALLSLYNTKTMSLTVSDCLGDTRVRAGTSVIVYFIVEGKEYFNYMLVESAKHTFKANEHKMDLKLRGGVFNS